MFMNRINFIDLLPHEKHTTDYLYRSFLNIPFACRQIGFDHVNHISTSCDDSVMDDEEEPRIAVSFFFKNGLSVFETANVI